MYLFFKMLARIVFMPLFRIEVIGGRNFNGGAVICSNHRSLADPIILSCVIKRRIYYMAKSELFTEHGRLFAWLLKSLGVFPVSRQSADRRALSRAEEILKNECVVGIFPQGKIVHDEKSFKIKSGASLLAMRTGSDIIPVSIYFEGAIRPFKRITVRIGNKIPVAREIGLCSKKCREISNKVSKEVELLLEAEHGNSFGKVGGLLLRSEQSHNNSERSP